MKNIFTFKTMDNSRIKTYAEYLRDIKNSIKTEYEDKKELHDAIPSNDLDYLKACVETLSKKCAKQEERIVALEKLFPSKIPKQEI